MTGEVRRFVQFTPSPGSVTLNMDRESGLLPEQVAQWLTTDRESGLLPEQVAEWLDRRTVEHAQIVERHYDNRRRLRLKVEQQSNAQGNAAPFSVTLGKCVVAKNLLVTVARFTPHQTRHERPSPLLSEFEPPSETQYDGSSEVLPGHSRHHHQRRELALHSMIELPAAERTKRADSRTRRAAEQLEREVGGQVDVWRPSATKDESGWRSPATAVDTRLPIMTRCRDNHMQGRAQDLRRALCYSASRAQRR